LVKEKKEARAKWRTYKKGSAEMTKKYLYERAEYLAQKMRTSEGKALRAVLRADDSKSIYNSIKILWENHKIPSPR
jgi:hypothetical protein